MSPTDLQCRIKNKIDEIDAIHNSLPGVVIVHHMPDGRIAYMSPNGLALLNITLEQVKAYTAEEYHEKYFNPEDAKDYVPKVLEWLQNNNDETITFFQQVRFAGADEWHWHLSSLKIILRDDAGTPILAISMSVKVDPVKHVTAKVERMLEENTFLRKNYDQFAKLTNRERDVLREQVLGYTSHEIADRLFISVRTAETHRRNIKQKLNVSSGFELAEYARAFDLI